MWSVIYRSFTQGVGQNGCEQSNTLEFERSIIRVLLKYAYGDLDEKNSRNFSKNFNENSFKDWYKNSFKDSYENSLNNSNKNLYTEIPTGVQAIPAGSYPKTFLGIPTRIPTGIPLKIPPVIPCIPSKKPFMNYSRSPFRYCSKGPFRDSSRSSFRNSSRYFIMIVYGKSSRIL